MISINDFVPGDRVHLLERDVLAPRILEATVKKVRSGYVWVSPEQTLHFTEDDQTGWGDILFKSRADAEQMLHNMKGRECGQRKKYEQFLFKTITND